MKILSINSNRTTIALLLILAINISQFVADIPSIATNNVDTNTTKIISDIKETKDFDKIVINTEEDMVAIEKNKTEIVAQTHTQIQGQKDVDALSTYIDRIEINPNFQMAYETEIQVQLQQEKHQQEIQNQQASLKPWISQQIKLFETNIEAIVSESFEFILDPEAQFVFRWNPPKNKELRLSIMVYRVLEGNIQLMKDNEENQFIDIQYQNQGDTYFKSIGSVYVNKIVNINFDTDYKYFRFVSRIGRSVFVMVDLERQQEIAPIQGIAKDDHLYIAAQKLATIESEVINGEKLREHTYKYEWGFLQNQYLHQSHLLGYTGAQLITIISAALTQLYLIKNLLDNRAVV